MYHVYLERHDTNKNMHRFYQLFVVRGLLGDWSLVREWGRVGSSGQVRKDWFDSVEQAIAAGERLRKVKGKKGYLTLKNELFF